MYRICLSIFGIFFEASSSILYIGLDSYACSSGIFLKENALVAVVTYISHSLFSRKKVRAMGDLAHVCC